MADNIPSIPGGAIPPKKETGKVQPKKETVRINLPPKPSAAPTIKLPTLPPAGPGGAPSPAFGAAAPAAPPRPGTAAPVAPQRPGTSAPAAPRPAAPVSAPAGAGRSVSGLDAVLAIVAAVVGLVAAGTVVWMMQL